jgi:hypothetical protein
LIAVLMAEVDWIRLIVYCGAVAALIAAGVYVALAVRDRMAAPQDYETVGDDLDSLRRALQLGSIDEAEYRRAVQALQLMNEKLKVKPPEPLLPELVLALPRPPGSNGPGNPAPPGPDFRELGGSQAEQDTANLRAAGEQMTEPELPRPGAN